MKQVDIWQAKLAARIHDPAEKAFVLMQDPSGHEGGTVRTLRHALLDKDVRKRWQNIVKKADHWASAADRPQFPQDANNRFASWAQVRFADKPELKHPLTAETFNLGSLKDVDFNHIKALSADHFDRLVQRDAAGDVDVKKTALAFWRFGSELDAEGLTQLWKLMPADTRVPDHTIWSHLDLTSAFAGAMAGDANEDPALLVMNFGPVQSFIAQARSISDLWAGSHLLSRMAWEGLKEVCDCCGPDAVLFPQLHGLPLVDAWIEEKLGGWPEGIKSPEYKRGQSDSNPLFAAALPNRFVAIVPADQAADIAQTVQKRVRDWVMQCGESALQMLQEKSGVSDAGYAKVQLQRQMDGFPDVHWMAVPWSLIKHEQGQLNADDLERVLRSYYPDSSKRPGMFKSNSWKLLSRELSVDGQRFFHPNGGVLYAALFDLLERANASAKAVRPFVQRKEEGYRCSLCGEREWLTPDKNDLFYPEGKREARLWQGLPSAWSRKGKEHLCALCSVKRLWPTLFGQEVESITGFQAQRFVVSTHTMALAKMLENADVSNLPDTLRTRLDAVSDRAALPAKLAGNLRKSKLDALEMASKCPVLLDQLRDDEEGNQQVRREIEQWLGKKQEQKIEAYYAFIMLDGDKMGAWLAGNESFTQTSYLQSWHTQIQVAMDQKSFSSSDLQDYLSETRPVSPARHAAISAALNSFALHLVRIAVEEQHHGKLIYAGGDDVLAMIPVSELLSCMTLLRLFYSGDLPKHDSEQLCTLACLGEIKMEHGFIQHRERLYRVMGKRATASAGAVIAHHTAPMQRVLKELRSAEKESKTKGGRDAFSVRVLKRGGGTVSTTAKWFASNDGLAHPILLLHQMAQMLGGADMSRRASYHVQAWLRELPARHLMNNDAAFERMLSMNIERQFLRQNSKKKEDVVRSMANAVAMLACNAAIGDEMKFLEGFLSVAEFLGREGRLEVQS